MSDKTEMRSLRVQFDKLAETNKKQNEKLDAIQAALDKLLSK